MLHNSRSCPSAQHYVNLIHGFTTVLALREREMWTVKSFVWEIFGLRETVKETE